MIPFPQTGTTLNPDGTIAPEGTIPQIGGGGTPVAPIPANPPFVPTPPAPVPPITVTVTPLPSPPVAPSVPDTPNVVLTQPYLDPPGTTRIYKTEDAYQVFPDNLGAYIYTYAIGTPAAPTRASFVVKNLCTQNTLGVTLNLPQFLDTSIGTTFLLPPLETQSIDLTVDETSSINLIEQRKQTYSEPIIVSVEVLNVNGPVYVQTPGFVPLPPPPPSGGETINTPSGSTIIPPSLPPAKRNLLLSQSLQPSGGGGFGGGGGVGRKPILMT